MIREFTIGLRVKVTRGWYKGNIGFIVRLEPRAAIVHFRGGWSDHRILYHHLEPAEGDS